MSNRKRQLLLVEALELEALRLWATVPAQVRHELCDRDYRRGFLGHEATQEINNSRRRKHEYTRGLLARTDLFSRAPVVVVRDRTRWQINRHPGAVEAFARAIRRMPARYFHVPIFFDGEEIG